MGQLRYETLREGHNQAVDHALARKDEAAKRESDRQIEATAAAERKQERIREIALQRFELEKATRYEAQKAGYEHRQREKAAREERERRSDLSLRANDPHEYKKQVQDRERNAERESHERWVKSQWAEKVRQLEQSDRSRASNGNKWSRELTDSERRTVDEIRARDERENERERERGR